MALLDLKSILGPINTIGKKTTGYFVKGAQDLFGNPGTTGPKVNDQSLQSRLGYGPTRPKKYKP
jgi:hypothetical protein